VRVVGGGGWGTRGGQGVGAWDRSWVITHNDQNMKIDTCPKRLSLFKTKQNSDFVESRAGGDENLDLL
jgi:hypothetical protein